MYSFGKNSVLALGSCHPYLQKIGNEAIKHCDHSIVYGHRTHEQQAELWAQGRTAPGKIVTYAKPGESKHNTYPSIAMDVAPYSVDIKNIRWEDERAFARLAGFYQALALMLLPKGCFIRWGGDWDNDGITQDERFVDLPHLELVIPR